MKFNLNKYIPSQEVLKGGLLASLFGLLPTIGLGAEYLFINVTKGIVILYGRNRCTPRTEYAPGSVELDSSWDMRVLPEDGAEAHPGFIPVFEEPKHKGYDAKGKEFELAAIDASCRSGNTLNLLVYRTTV